MYLENRIKGRKPGKFIEIGPGSGEVTNCLLHCGWEGSSVDLEPITIEKLKHRFRAEIECDRFDAICGDFLELHVDEAVDLVISCMVMEHLDDTGVNRFWQQANRLLKSDGVMITIVPASQKHRGIEDEIAGHYRRYDRVHARGVASRNNYAIEHMASLTYPLSNLLLPVSNYLVRRQEARHLALSMTERTRLSGKREVSMKTRFPDVFKLILNRVTLYPFYLLQRFTLGSESALVLYFEARPRHPGNT